jgi:hypothetical protein
MAVILEPESLVNCIEPEVGGMRKVEVHQVTAVHQTGGIQGHIASNATRTRRHSRTSPEPIELDMKKSLSILAVIC